MGRKNGGLRYSKIILIKGILMYFHVMIYTDKTKEVYELDYTETKSIEEKIVSKYLAKKRFQFSGQSIEAIEVKVIMITQTDKKSNYYYNLMLREREKVDAPIVNERGYYVTKYKKYRNDITNQIIENVSNQKQITKHEIIIEDPILGKDIKSHRVEEKGIDIIDSNKAKNCKDTEKHTSEIDKNYAKRNIGDQLLNKLKNCPIGVIGWKTFEDISVDIIDYVFRESFRNFKIKIQMRNFDDIDIRDAIIQNTGKNDFWKELRSDYDAKNIVFEFKNLSKGVGKGELIQVSDYLKKKSLGRVGIIFSRRGLSKSGSKEQRSLLVHDKKLILVLDNDDLKSLIKKKQQLEEPEQILEVLKFDIEASP